MFTNRISRFQFNATENVAQNAAAKPPAAFAVLPGSGASAAPVGGPPDVYRLAYEQAQKQVAARRERQRRSHEWN